MRKSALGMLLVGLLVAADVPRVEVPKVEWTLDLDKMKIPEAPVTGSIEGKPFSMEKAQLQGGVLTLRQGKEFFPDAAVLLFLFLKAGETVEGKTYRIPSDRGPGTPHIHKQWRPQGEKVPKSQGFVEKYALILEFGKVVDGKVQGKIYLSLPDEAKSFVAGTFVVDVK